MNYSLSAVSGLTALGLAVALAVGLASGVGEDPSNTAEAPTAQVPTRTIDLDELPSGDEPVIPWLADGTIRTPDADLPVNNGLDIRKFTAIGPSEVLALDDTTGDGTANRLVHIDEQGTTEIAAGPVATFAVSLDRNSVAWSEWAGESGRLVHAEADTGDVLAQTPIDAQAYVTGFSQHTVIVERPYPHAAQIWDPTLTGPEPLTDIHDTKGATATDPKRGLTSVVTKHVDDPETGAPLACSSVIDTHANAELWSTCQAIPISFSPDGRYIWARDTRTDDALPSSMFLLDAETGQKAMHVEVEGVTQRVSWEPGGSIVFDAWTGGNMALVRCSTAADGDCELATRPEPSEPPALKSLPYLLAHQS